MGWTRACLHVKFQRAVFSCSRSVDSRKIPTEAVIVTFAGTTRPTEIKAWPLTNRVEALSSRPMQCHKCWCFGHSINGFRSLVRCQMCAEHHHADECAVQERSCLCGVPHPADDGSCLAKVQEIFIKSRPVGHQP